MTNPTPDSAPTLPPPSLVVPCQSLDLADTPGPEGTVATLLVLGNPMVRAQIALTDDQLENFVTILQERLQVHAGATLAIPEKRLVVAHGSPVAEARFANRAARRAGLDPANR